MQVPDWKARSGRGKYCSNACKYEYRVRPSGLRYEIKQVNSAWIAPGQHLSPSTEFQRGVRPQNWKGDTVGYCALHDWVRKHRGNPRVCEFCLSVEKVQWANKSFEYKRDLDDWIALCYWCHRKYDLQGDWGAAARKFDRNASGGYR